MTSSTQSLSHHLFRKYFLSVVGPPKQYCLQSPVTHLSLAKGDQDHHVHTAV